MLGLGSARPLDEVFVGLLPVDKLTRSVLLTSAILHARGMQHTSWGGVPQCVGVMLSRFRMSSALRRIRG